MGILKITPNGASHPGNIGLKKTGGATKRRQQTRQGTAAQLFGQNLNKALAGKQKSTTQQPTKQTRTTIHTAANILNSFSLTASIRSGATENGRFIIAMYQGNFSARSRAMGYRLAYKLGGSLDLIKLTSRGSTVLGTTILRRPQRIINSEPLFGNAAQMGAWLSVLMVRKFYPQMTVGSAIRFMVWR